MTIHLRYIGASMTSSIMIEREKINTRGKKPPLVLPTFCPFCGERLGAEKATAESVKAELETDVGTCCKGADPLCAVECAVETALKLRAAQ